jgi:hypothetical protein
MTSLEVINMVALLTDDSQAWFPLEDGRDYTFLFETITQAQLKTIEKYYTSQEERALRTLYVTTSVMTGAQILDILYPRALLIADSYTSGQTTTINYYNASYENYDTYINLPTLKSSIYTFKGNQILFNLGDTGTLYYLKVPRPFFHTNPGFNNADTTLSLPVEYHFEVCCLAAEMINNLDKEEKERSTALDKNSAIPIESLGGA